MKKYSTQITLLVITFIIVTVSSLTACTTNTTEQVRETSPLASSSPLSPTKTPFPPPPTTIPVAAVVNGDDITIEEYQAELARYKMVVDREFTEEDKEIVINDLIQLTLLAQAAYSEGFELDDAAIQAHIEELNNEEQPLEDWLANHSYTDESFRVSLRRSLAAAWMRDEIIADIPETAEQVHVQQVLYYTYPEANYALNQLMSGTEFAQLAATRDPQTKGDLGWFPREYLTIPQLDEVVFNLEVEKYSDIIETEIGYHIVIVIAKEQNRLLPPDMLRIQQERAFHDWLERRWKLSTITITLP